MTKIKCENCETLNDENINFCTKCGNSLNDENYAESKEIFGNNENQPETKKTSNDTENQEESHEIPIKFNEDQAEIEEISDNKDEINLVSCPYCGSQIPNNVPKCRYCGEWVDKTKDPSISNKISTLFGKVNNEIKDKLNNVNEFNNNAVKYCSKCGEGIDSETSKFCPKCGTNLN